MLNATSGALSWGAGRSAWGQKVALTAPKSDFRYTGESGLKTDIVPCPCQEQTLSVRQLRPPAILWIRLSHSLLLMALQDPQGRMAEICARQ